jgi:hypothetical protein
VDHGRDCFSYVARCFSRRVTNHNFEAVHEEAIVDLLLEDL